MSDRVDRTVLKWFGHVERMSEERMTKTLQELSVEDRRDRGKLCRRWLNGVKKAYNARSLEQKLVKMNCMGPEQQSEFVNRTNSGMNE